MADQRTEYDLAILETSLLKMGSLDIATIGVVGTSGLNARATSPPAIKMTSGAALSTSCAKDAYLSEPSSLETLKMARF